MMSVSIDPNGWEAQRAFVMDRLEKLDAMDVRSIAQSQSLAVIENGMKRLLGDGNGEKGLIASLGRRITALEKYRWQAGGVLLVVGYAVAYFIHHRP